MPKKATTQREHAEKRLLADRLHSAAIHLLRRLRRVDDAIGLSAPKLSALSVIVYAGPITLGDLAAAEQVRPPTMTRLVDELEKARLVVRQADAQDRRVSRVRATALGTRLLKRGRSRRVLVLANWLESLPTEDVRKLEAAVQILDNVARPGLSIKDKDA